MKLKTFGKKREAREETAAPTNATEVKKNAGRQLIVSSCLTFLSVLVLAAATMAWFANNREVNSGGMQMQVETSPNLVIAQSADGEGGIATKTATDASFSTTFDTPAQLLTPSTHDWGTFYRAADTSVTSTTGLKYNCNPSVIHPSTGEERDGKTIYYNKSENDDENEKYYFVDYEVYIASVSKPLPINGLTATLNSADADTSTYDYHNAASVDFYLGSVSSSNYKGTLNLAGLDYSVNDGSEPCTEVEIISGSYTVPLNTADSDNYIKVIMRFYFDGALQESDGQAFVYSDGLTTANFSMKVTFTAEE